MDEVEISRAKRRVSLLMVPVVLIWIAVALVAFIVIWTATHPEL